MKSTITAKQRRIVKAKIKGLKNTEIGKIEYANANPTSQRQLVSRELKKRPVAQYYEQTKTIALKEANITWKRVTEAISKGLDDDNKYLQAAKQAAELLESKSIGDKEEYKELPSNISEIQLVRLLKNKD